MLHSHSGYEPRECGTQTYTQPLTTCITQLCKMYQEYYSFSHLFNDDLFLRYMLVCMRWCMYVFVCRTGIVCRACLALVWFGFISFRFIWLGIVLSFETWHDSFSSGSFSSNKQWCKEVGETHKHISNANIWLKLVHLINVYTQQSHTHTISNGICSACSCCESSP